LVAVVVPDEIEQIAFLLGFIIGGYCSIAYVIQSIRRGSKPRFEQAAGLFLAGLGITAAIRVALLAIGTTSGSLAPFNEGDRATILIGAGFIMWASFTTLSALIPKVSDLE
jgi:hypothetical protein